MLIFLHIISLPPTIFAPVAVLFVVRVDDVNVNVCVIGTEHVAVPTKLNVQVFNANVVPVIA